MTRLPRRVFAAIAVAWVAVAHVGPLVAMLRISLLDSFPAAPGVPASFSLDAFRALFEGAGYRAALGHSLLLATLATVISLVLAWPLAWHVAVRIRRRDRGRRLAFLVAPFWTSEVLRMFALVLLLSNRGAVNGVLRWTGLTDAPVPLLYGAGSVLTGIVYTVMLSMLLPLAASLSRLPETLLDAATDLGANRWQRQLFVALPLVSGGLASGMALTFILALGVLAAPALLGGAGTPTFATVIAGLFGGASGRWPLGAAFGLALLLTGTICAAGMAWSAREIIARTLGRERVSM
jgi:spermidine/putrescine transport system permease protein